MLTVLAKLAAAVEPRDDLEEQNVQTNPGIFNASSQRCKTLFSGFRRKVFFFSFMFEKKGEEEGKKSCIRFLIKKIPGICNIQGHILGQGTLSHLIVR